jgi:hypothetical protein
VGGLGNGVKKTTPLLNLTRLHNAVSACGMMARPLQLLRDYAARRVAFGSRLADKPLHRETLADLQVEYEAALALTFEGARLLGRVESGEAADGERGVLRVVTPLAKLLTAKQAVAVASEALEGFGGAGYVEDTGLPVWLRDAQVLPIWEGTTNVLSLDVLRAAAREDALSGFLAATRRRLAALRTTPLGDVARSVGERLEALAEWWRAARDAGAEVTEAGARCFALSLAAVAAAVPLSEQAAWAERSGRGPRCAIAARRWAAARIPSLPDPRTLAARVEASRVLAGVDEIVDFKPT